MAMHISKSVQENVKFISDIIQTLVIVFGGMWAVVTYVGQQKSEIESTRRELERPYDERQLDLYLEASRVVAHLAKQPTGPEKDVLEARFWELYWGELAFVESRVGKVPADQTPVETLMVEFCGQYFGDSKCHADSPTLTAAYKLAHQASDEIRRRWTTAAE